MNTEQPYDLIGDIHGQHGKLVALLAHLGYEPRTEADGRTWRHPQGRKVVFLGDYVDRGPAIRDVLHTVRGMVEAGDALALMGNHEYNHVCYHTPNGRGGWLRPRTASNTRQSAATLAQFADHPAEWEEWLAWMKRLPIYLDLGRLRAVHACWDAASIAMIQQASLAEEDFLHRAGTYETPEFRAVERLLKGPELALPEGVVFHDKEQTAHTTVRVRWWDIPAKARISHLAMPTPFDIPAEASAEDLSQVPDYGAHEPPVFVGHYWLPASREKAPLTTNIACLDFSAARGGPLVAYRWDGEAALCAEKFTLAAS